MIEIKKYQGEVILSREQLERLDGIQAEFATLMGGIRESVEEFGNVMLRHYFNRENGFLNEQRNNLREVAELRDRLNELAGQMSGGTVELGAFLQKVLAESANIRNVEKAPPSENTTRPVPEGGKARAGVGAAAGADKQQSRLVLPTSAPLQDVSIMGGEISIKLFFEELGILLPERRELLKDITRQLHDLLYERKLVGYSKTSLVFGRDRSLAQVLETLEPLFLSENIRALLDQKAPEAGRAKLRLGCTRDRELVYIVSEEARG